MSRFEVVWVEYDGEPYFLGLFDDEAAADVFASRFRPIDGFDGLGWVRVRPERQPEPDVGPAVKWHLIKDELAGMTGEDVIRSSSVFLEPPIGPERYDDFSRHRPHRQVMLVAEVYAPSRAQAVAKFEGHFNVPFEWPEETTTPGQ